jgi:hypothetical protein
MRFDLLGIAWSDPHGIKKGRICATLMKNVRRENRAGKMATYSFPQA